MEARFKALLKTEVESSRNAYECIHPVSAAFTVADIGKLVDIICTSESESAVFHALVALLHDHINIRTAATPQIIEALVQRAISFDPDAYDEILLFAFQAVLEEIGERLLLTHLYSRTHKTISSVLLECFLSRSQCSNKLCL